MDVLKRIAKLTSNFVPFDLIQNEDKAVDLVFFRFIAQMPTEIVRALLALLEEIRGAKYYWKPFMIGDSYVPKPDDANKLHHIHAYLLHRE